MIFTLSNTQLTVFIKGRPYSIDSSHPNWDHMNKMVRGEIPTTSDDEIIHLMNVRAAVEEKLKDYGRIKVGEDQIIIDGIPTHNYSTRRILDMLREGLDITPWINFLDRAISNPAAHVFGELFNWLEASNLPVTPEGKFLAYKKVDDDYLSYHPSPDGTHQEHKFGKPITMPRYQVDDDRTNYCSTGFHFANWEYVNQHYYPGRGRILILEVDPAEVVTIPNDYSFAKGRATGYTPVGEVPREDWEEVPDLVNVYVYEDYDYDVDEIY